LLSPWSSSTAVTHHTIAVIMCDKLRLLPVCPEGPFFVRAQSMSYSQYNNDMQY